jgi:hypothetical protein
VIKLEISEKVAVISLIGVRHVSDTILGIGGKKKEVREGGYILWRGGGLGDRI